MEQVIQSKALAPFNYYISQTLGLVIKKSPSLIVGSILTSMIGLVIFTLSLIPLALSTAFLIVSKTPEDITFSLFLLFCSLIFFFAGILYQTMLRLNTSVLIIAGKESTLDAVSTSLTKSKNVFFSGLYLIALLESLAIVFLISTCLLLLLSKFAIFFLFPILIIIPFLLIYLVFAPIIASLEGTSALESIYESIRIVKGHVIALIGRLILFSFVIIVAVLLVNYLVFKPLEFFGSMFSYNSYFNVLLTYYIPKTITIIGALIIPFLHIIFVVTLYKNLREITPAVSANTYSKPMRYSVKTLVGMGLVGMYLLIMGLTTTSFYVFKPRALLNQLGISSKVQDIKSNIRN